MIGSAMFEYYDGSSLRYEIWERNNCGLNVSILNVSILNADDMGGSSRKLCTIHTTHHSKWLNSSLILFIYRIIIITLHFHLNNHQSAALSYINRASHVLSLCFTSTRWHAFEETRPLWKSSSIRHDEYYLSCFSPSLWLARLAGAAWAPPRYLPSFYWYYSNRSSIC